MFSEQDLLMRCYSVRAVKQEEEKMSTPLIQLLKQEKH